MFLSCFLLTVQMELLPGIFTSSGTYPIGRLLTRDPVTFAGPFSIDAQPDIQIWTLNPQDYNLQIPF